MIINDNRYQKVYDLANNAKNALIELFNEDGHFSDKDKMRDGGLMADAVGLTSIMLIDVAFYGTDGGNVIKKNDTESISAIINSMLPQLYKKISKFGYTADPVVSRKNTKNIFGKEQGIGSTDTMTWILSLCSITRYAHRKGFVQLSEECSSIISELAAEVIVLLCQSQLPDGTWGFMTNEADATERAKRSLYFSYVVSQCFADFFDYIRGDIDNPNEDYQRTYEDYYDRVFAEELDKTVTEKLGKSAIDAVYESRQKLQEWVITYCLPVLPKLSSCKELTKEEKDSLGIWDTSFDPKKEEFNYFNLYYTNYILDMMITSEVDSRFKDLRLEEYIDEVYDGTPSSETKATVQYRILQSYKASPSIPSSDKEFFFGLVGNKQEKMGYLKDRNHIKNFLDNYHQQAIHNSRALYMASSHSNKFWDQSELAIKWEHESPSIETEIRNINGITDPAFVPMALRTNASFCFYKAESGDFFVDNLFDYICSDVYSDQVLQDDDDEDDYENCITGLWDTIKFNLFVTERSIEAIVDYYDYLNKLFPQQEESAAPTGAAVKPAEKMIKEEKTDVSSGEIDLAVEKKIEAFLTSEKGQEILREALSPAEEQGNRSLDIDGFSSYIKDHIIQGESVRSGAESYATLLTEEQRKGDNSSTLPFIELYEHLKNYSLIEKIFSCIKQKKGEPDNTYQERVFKIYKRLSSDIEDFSIALINGIDSSEFKSSDLKKMWQKFKTDNSTDI